MRRRGSPFLMARAPGVGQVAQRGSALHSKRRTARPVRQAMTRAEQNVVVLHCCSITRAEQNVLVVLHCCSWSTRSRSQCGRSTAHSGGGWAAALERVSVKGSFAGTDARRGERGVKGAPSVGAGASATAAGWLPRRTDPRHRCGTFRAVNTTCRGAHDLL